MWSFDPRDAARRFSIVKCSSNRRRNKICSTSGESDARDGNDMRDGNGVYAYGGTSRNGCLKLEDRQFEVGGRLR